MKKTKKLFILFIPIILFFSIALIFQLQCRTIHSGIREPCDEIYIPKGIADNYTDLLTFSIDEHKIWEYRLNSDEKKIIEQDLGNGIWDKITGESMEEIKYFFTVNSDSYFPESISDDSYYCIYHFSLKEYVRTDDIVGHTALFLYDKENSRYFCISHSI